MMMFLRDLFRASLLALGLAACIATAQAQAPVQAPQLAARAWVLVDMSTGETLAAQDADGKVEPASLTKLMTTYLAFEALRDKRITSDQRPPVSQLAYKASGSRMFVEPAKPATVDELLHGMIIQSGNDATIVLAEAIAGTEATFVELMNKTAAKFGMSGSHFTNSTGLPDAQHYSTANDLAKLTMRLIRDHPEGYPLHAIREYTYNKIRQPNRNRLLFSDPTVDGVKTGHTESAGFCLIASAHRDQPGGGFERRLVSVVLGAASDDARMAESQKLLNWGFQNFDVVRAFTKDQVIGTYEVWKGAKKTITAGVPEEVRVTVAKGQAENLKSEVERIQPLLAPIQKGQKLGVLRLKAGDKLVLERPLLAMEDVELGGFITRTVDAIKLWLK